MDIRLHFVSEHTVEEGLTQTPKVAFLFFHVQGLLQYRGPGGEFFSPPPFLSLILPEERFLFRFDASRINWVIGFQCDGLAAGPNRREAVLKWNDSPVIIPRMCVLSPAEVLHFQEECRQMRMLLWQPTPAGICSAGLGAAAFLRRLITPSEVVKGLSPAGQLKSLIDDSANRDVSLLELSQRCGYSVEHLRQLFREKFHISPKQYRQRQLIAQAMTLVADTQLTVKEISCRLGYNYVSHFSAQFKAATGIPPTRAIQRYRYNADV